MIEHGPRPAAAPERPDGTPGARVIAATIVTGAGEIRYRRAGRGRPVVLLTAGAASRAAGALVLHYLAGRFRVIAPDRRVAPAGVRARGTAAACAWIGDVIDGLGLERPSVVADESFGLAALRFAMLDPERVDRLVVLTDDRMAPVAGAAASGDGGADSFPLLLLPIEVAARGPDLSLDAIAAMLQFLGPHA